MNPVAPVLIETGMAGGGHSRSVARAGRCGVIVAGVAVLHWVLLAAVLRGEPVRMEHEHVRVITATLLSPASSAMSDTPAVPARRDPALHPASPPVRHIPLPRVSHTPSPVSMHRPVPPLAASAPWLPSMITAATAAHNASEPAVTESAGGPRESGATQAATAIVTPRRVAHLDCAMVKPDYPPRALRRGETGTVVVELETDVSGRVSTARVGTSSGHAQLDEAARNAVFASHCHPYIENGMPVPARADVPVTFSLDE